MMEIMNEARISVSWESYLTNVSKGFSELQQNAEFVDMTLAAEGHLVKVHQNIVAVASPYLKAMLQSASCRHPVIFLNNISHIILGYILEYIYTGEVKIPSNKIDKFVEACKSLCISGLDTVAIPKNVPGKQQQRPIERMDKRDNPPDNNFAAHITINTQDNHYNFELIPNENSVINNNEVEISTNVCPSPAICNDNNDINFATSNIITDGNEAYNNLVILKSNSNAGNAMDLSIIGAENPIKVLSNIPISTNGWHLKSNNSQIGFGDILAEKSVNMNNWLNEMNKNGSNIELKTITIQNPVNVTEENPSNPNQSNLPIQLNANQTVNALRSEDDQSKTKPTNISSCKRKIPKKLKKINSIKLSMNPVEKGPKINKFNKTEIDNAPYYTISSRSSLQLLLNRFLYHSHHHSQGGRKRRWRCIDYRKMHCPAYIDTDNEDIISVAKNHCHPNHDNQIRKKIKNNIIFTSLSNAETTINTLLCENSNG